MRLDIVTNDAGELVRREHARDLGAGVVVSLYRLARLAQMHDLGNQAFVRQLEQTHASIGEYCLRAGTSVNLLFAQKAVFVAGQLLKGSRATYEAAALLAEILEWCGGSELSIARDVEARELQAFAEAISAAMKAEKGRGFRSPSPRIRLRAVNEAARRRGIDVERLPLEQRIVRTYATAVVVLRRFFDDLAASRYVLPRRIKRVAQSLVDLSEGSTPAFLGVTEVRNQNHDAAGRAVNTAILAVAAARELTRDKATLAQIAMAAMMFDAGRPRAAAIAASGGPRLSAVAVRLSEDAEDRLPAGTAAVLTALGRVNEPSITRTVITFEALWQRRAASIGPPYRGARLPTLHARIVAVARRYNDLLTPEPGLPPASPDAAVATLGEELTEPADRTVLRMLVAALGLLPAGTVVQLSSGEVGEVLSTAARGRPKVRVAMDAHGSVLGAPIEVDLARPGEARTVARVMSVDGWKKGPERPPRASHPAAEASTPSRSAVVPTEPRVRVAARSPVTIPPPNVPTPPPPVATVAPPGRAPMHATTPPPPPPPAEDVSDVGTSPSKVGESMGRMIEETLRGTPLPGEPRPEPATAPPPPRITAPPPGSTRPTAPPPKRDWTITDTTEKPRPADAATTLADLKAAPAVPLPVEVPAVPTARGTLATTPLAHVLVYMLDHVLSGSIVLREPDAPVAPDGPVQAGAEHVLHFQHGAVCKVDVARPSTRIGDELVAAGLVSRVVVTEAVEGARRLGVLIGEYLVGHDIVPREALHAALEQQIASRVASLVNLPPETTYSFYRDVDLLPAMETEGVVSDPLNVILATVRRWDDRARIRATLARVARHPLVFHPAADPTSLALTPAERAVIDFVRDARPTTSGLFQRRVADEEATSSLIYALSVTRQFAFKGQKKPPMGTKGADLPISVAPPLPEPPPSSKLVDLGDDMGRLSALPGSPSQPAPEEVQSILPNAWPVRPASDERPHPSRSGADVENAERALEAMTHFRLAESALGRGDLAQAERLATRAAAGDPEQADYRALLAWVRAQAVTTDAAAQDAAQALTAILAEDPDNERALLFRGKLAKRLGRAAEALKDFERIVQANPRHREATIEARLLKQRAPKR